MYLWLREERRRCTRSWTPAHAAHLLQDRDALESLHEANLDLSVGALVV